MNDLIQISYRYYNEALELINEKKVSHSKKKLEESIKFYCKDVEILNLIGCCEYLLCDFNKAHFYWNQSIKINNINNKAINYIQGLHSKEFQELLLYYNRGIECINKKNYEEATDLLEKVIEMDTSIIEPYYIIGLCFAELNNYNKALEYLNLANDKDRGNSKYLNCINNIIDNKEPKIVTIDHKRKKYKYIIAALILAIIIPSASLASKNKKLNLEYQTLAKIKEEEQEAILLQLREQKDINSNLNNEIKVFNNTGIDISKALFEKSVSYYKTGDYEKAIEGFKYIVIKDEDESYIKSEAIYFIAASYEKIKEYDLAINYYERYISLYPKGNYYDESLYNAGLMLFNNNEINKAREFLQKLKSDVPDSIYVNSKVKLILE